HELDSQLLRLTASLTWARIQGRDGLLAHVESAVHGKNLLSGQPRGSRILLVFRPGVEERRVTFDLQQSQARGGIDDSLQQASDHVLRVNEARSVSFHEGCIASNISDDE